MKIKIKNCQRKITINKKSIAYLSRQILKVKGIQGSELSILFAGKEQIRKLNKKFRGIDRPTDVLAFSMHEGKGTHLHPQILGDVVICPEIARDAASSYNTSLKQEIYLYLVHGVLHLLGYDDTNTGNRCLMETEQRRILKKILK